MGREKLNPPPGPGDHYRGPADAPVVLVEYGDYECPRCATAHAVVERLFADLGDSLRFVYRHYAITDVHHDAGAAAEAAESVAAHGGNDAFWDMHEMLLANQDALDVDDLLGYAEAAGVDVHAVAEDLASGAYRARVQADFASGLRSGINGTPAFFINNDCFEGDWTDAAVLGAALRAAAYANSRS